MLPVISQGREKFEFGLFGAVGECAIQAYATSSTARNAFFLTSQAQKKNSNVFFNGNYMMFIKYFFKDCPFSFTGSFQSCIFLPRLLHSSSAYRRMCGMKKNAVGAGA